MKNNNFITIQGWMVNDLKLSSNELICYALIYGFTQDEESEFRGSLQYISDWLGISKQNARLIIKRLVEKGLIIKRDEFINNVKFCRYTVCMKQPHGMNVSCIGGGNETATDNNSNNNKDNKKKEIYKEIVDYWNEHTKSYSKVRQVTAKIESAINARIRDGYSIDDIKKALLLCESLGDFYKGKEPGKNWKANFYWIISNTNSNFDKILTGDLHISSEQQREFKKVMNGEEYNSTQYNPSTNGSDVRWNEPSQCYICFYPWAFDNLCDGYTKDTRPDNATVYCQGRKYVWSKKQQKWEHD